jgi:hypothetical protein
MQGWQPIETAPKDGTLICAYGIAHGDYGYTEAESTEFKIRWRKNMAGCGMWEIDDITPRYFNGFTPKHWMPLPDPPTN